ncbi:Uncharacterised protein [Klebsiella pneumoniae]|uniref:Uncharacterized protein n=1 Tax=Klebsiella pneumoniae TaxID=573 RepID=A0A377V478_KLEPN|nr:Uncharacterised protein [Klebsiella pneumoniae]
MSSRAVSIWSSGISFSPRRLRIAVSSVESCFSQMACAISLSCGDSVIISGNSHATALLVTYSVSAFKSPPSRVCMRINNTQTSCISPLSISRAPVSDVRVCQLVWRLFYFIEYWINHQPFNIYICAPCSAYDVSELGHFDKLAIPMKRMHDDSCCRKIKTLC